MHSPFEHRAGRERNGREFFCFFAFGSASVVLAHLPPYAPSLPSVRHKALVADAAVRAHGIHAHRVLAEGPLVMSLAAFVDVSTLPAAVQLEALEAVTPTPSHATAVPAGTLVGVGGGGAVIVAALRCVHLFPPVAIHPSARAVAWHPPSAVTQVGEVG